MYFNIHSGSCAPAERDLPSLATIFSQALSLSKKVMPAQRGIHKAGPFLTSPGIFDHL